MKLKDNSGITLLVLVVTIIIMLILVVVSIGSFDGQVFNDLKKVNEEGKEVRGLQDQETMNAINGLGGLE